MIKKKLYELEDSFVEKICEELAESEMMKNNFILPDETVDAYNARLEEEYNKAYKNLKKTFKKATR